MVEKNELSNLIKEALFEVAPDLEGEEVLDNETFQDQFGIDSMDALNIMVILNERTGVEIPEVDYPELATLAGAVAYLEGKIS